MNTFDRLKTATAQNDSRSGGSYGHGNGRGDGRGYSNAIADGVGDGLYFDYGHNNGDGQGRGNGNGYTDGDGEGYDGTLAYGLLLCVDVTHLRPRAINLIVRASSCLFQSSLCSTSSDKAPS